MQYCNWGGHHLPIYSLADEWPDLPGIYVYAMRSTSNWLAWIPVYIGQASSMKSRLSNHERWADAVRAGATHIHAMCVSEQAQRDSIERELVFAYQPALNERLRNGAALGLLNPLRAMPHPFAGGLAAADVAPKITSPWSLGLGGLHTLK